jgi:SAM-dependent methyltransferase
MKHWGEMPPLWHDHYERGRPGYPSDVISVAGVAASASVLELGAGTGKLTRLLVHEYAHVAAVEPDPEMRRWFMATCPEAALIGAAAEQIPLADGAVDAVFSAESFHWFAHGRALFEIARVLRPLGTLVLMWNRPAGSVEPSIAAVERLLEPIWPDGIEMPLDLDPRRFPYARDWPLAFAQSPFAPLQETTLDNTLIVDADGLVAFFGSMGWIGGLPEDEQVKLLDKIRSRLAADEYRMPFTTHVHTTRLSQRT